MLTRIKNFYMNPEQIYTVSQAVQTDGNVIPVYTRVNDITRTTGYRIGATVLIVGLYMITLPILVAIFAQAVHNLR